MNLIDREKLVQEIKRQANGVRLGEITASVLDTELIIQLIVDSPTVDVYTEQDVRDVFNDGYSVGMEQAVRHGKWIAQDTSRTKFMCSECKSENYGGHENYCPVCKTMVHSSYCSGCGQAIDWGE